MVSIDGETQQTGCCGRRGILKNVGLFGGTFNPIHLGHLRAADEAGRKFPLDEICFIPSAIPPHKQPEALADAADRMEMIRLAIAGRRSFSASDVEISRAGRSFTIDTVRHFKSALPRQNLFLLMGLDAFLEIHTWHAFRQLLQLIAIVVLTRPGRAIGQAQLGWQKIQDYIAERISNRYRFAAAGPCYRHPENPPIYMLDIGLLDISSTQIRRRIRTGQPLDGLVPAAVESYIRSKGLYV